MVEVVDWVTWPIFVLQLIAFGLFFLPADKKIIGCKPRYLIMAILLITCLAIALSLHHDAADPLHLYF